MSRRDYNEWLGYLTGNLSTLSVDVLDKVEGMGVRDIYAKANLVQHIYGVVEIGEEVELIRPTRLYSGSTFHKEISSQALEAWKLYKDGERNMEFANPLRNMGIKDLNEELERELGVSHKLNNPSRKDEEERNLRKISEELGLGTLESSFEDSDWVEGVNDIGVEGTSTTAQAFLSSLKSINTSAAEGSVYHQPDSLYPEVDKEEEVDLYDFVNSEDTSSFVDVGVDVEDWVDSQEELYPDVVEEEIVDEEIYAEDFAEMQEIFGFTQGGVTQTEDDSEEVDWGSFYYNSEVEGEVSDSEEPYYDEDGEEEPIDWGALYGITEEGVDSNESPEEYNEEPIDWAAHYHQSEEESKIEPDSPAVTSQVSEKDVKPLIGYASDVEMGIIPLESPLSLTKTSEQPLTVVDAFSRSSEKDLVFVARKLHSLGSKLLNHKQ